MVGTKGHSGIPTTQDASRRRSAAAALREIRLADDQSHIDSVGGAEQLKTPISWREACQQQTAACQALKKKLLKIELETAERSRISMPEIKEFLVSFRSQVLREFASLPGISEGLPDARPHQLDWLRSELLKWIDRTKTTIGKMDIQ